MNKKLLIGILAILIFFISTIFKSNSHLPQASTIEPSAQDNKNPLIYAYYSSIDEAVENNTFADGKPADYKIKQKIKIVEDEDYCLLYAVNIQPNGEEIFSLFMFKIRIKNETKEYSNPISHFPTVRSFISDSENEKGIVKAQQEFLSLFNLATKEDKIERYPNFIWSLSTDKYIYQIKVNNQKPTEIIPFKIGKDKLYFYYFDDLKNNDEFTITT